MDSYLVVRAVPDQRLGVQESCSGDGGTLSLSVLQKQVGTQLLPGHQPCTADIYLNMKQLKETHREATTFTKPSLFLLTSLKNLSTHVSSISGPITDLRASRNSSNFIPHSSFPPLLLPLLLFGLFSCMCSPAFGQVNAFLRHCRCSGLSFSGGLTSQAGSLQREPDSNNYFKENLLICAGIAVNTSWNSFLLSGDTFRDG